MKASKLIASAVTFVVLISGILMINYVGKNHQSMPMEILASEFTVKDTELPILPIRGSFVVDMNNMNETVGLVDYVFAAKVISNDKTIYRNIVTMETENGGTKEVGSPYTQYTIEVIDNIKGNLKKNSPFEILKHGGIEQNQEAVFVFEDDELPQEGEYYIFLGYAQDDGSILISGPNSNISLDANNKQEIVSSDIYKNYEKSFKNEVKFTRERSKSKFEE